MFKFCSAWFYLYCILFSALLWLFYAFVCCEDSYLMSQSLNEVRSDYPNFPSSFNVSTNTGKLNEGCPKIPMPFKRYVPTTHSDPLTDLEKVLAMCKQETIISLDSYFTHNMRKTLTKIGEGAFVDVFGCQDENWNRLAIKVIPIEGHEKYNHLMQNTLKSIQTEMVVSLELSLLGDEARRLDKKVRHYTKNFMQITRIGLCRGKYPNFLKEAWLQFEYSNIRSNNDNPNFSSTQQYIIFSTENAGIPLARYVLHSFEEAISILQQVSAALAVGESVVQFEHRDLHRNNVLVSRTQQEYIYFRLDGVEYSIKSYGVMATVIDYTLSRITQGTECISYTDLDEVPWLFKDDGGIQSETYMMVKNHTSSQWKNFFPYTNVLWINYLTTQIRDRALVKMNDLNFAVWERQVEVYRSHILDCDSAKEVFQKVFSPEAVRRIDSLMTS